MPSKIAIISWLDDYPPGGGGNPPGGGGNPPSGDLPPPIAGRNYALEFADEFDGTSLNLDEWKPNWYGSSPTAITNPVNSYEVAAYDPACVSVSDGKLVLTTIERPCTTENGKWFQYRAGFIETKKKFGYGYFEAHMCLEGDGSTIVNWPAFWLHNAADATWPTGGEIDIMEGLSGQATSTYHWGSPNNAQKDGRSASGDWTGWSTFGVLYEPGSIKFFYDNELHHTITGDHVVDQPFFAILGNQMGQWGGPARVPSHMLVDWIRVWLPK